MSSSLKPFTRNAQWSVLDPRPNTGGWEEGEGGEGGVVGQGGNDPHPGQQQHAGGQIGEYVDGAQENNL